MRIQKVQGPRRRRGSCWDEQKCVPDKGSSICPPGKSMIYFTIVIFDSLCPPLIIDDEFLNVISVNFRELHKYVVSMNIPDQG